MAPRARPNGSSPYNQSMITKKDIQKIAGLAKLNLSDEEMDRYTRELGNILGFVEKLDKLDLTGVAATSHAVAVTNVFREDKAVDSGIQADVFEKAPSVEDNLFKVPRVI